MPAPTVLLGAVAYDPKVVTIWEGFRAWLRGQGLDFDFVLYSHYERQVEDLLAGRIDAAWNSPLAWLRAERLAAATGTAVRALTMRDTDQDLTSVVVVREDSPVRRIADLAGRVVAVGAVDSPQATLIPLGHLAAAGVTVDVRRFDVGVGLHGDHIGGERDAARALVAGEVDAACMIDANHLAFVQEGTLPPEGTRVVAQTARYDHCNMTVRAPESDGVRLFGRLLLGMSYADPQVRPLLDLEGLKAWREGRTTGYDALADAVDANGFYSPDGRVTATDYRP
ncbi:phosphate/phosphite/phosphonate ABC transporter substrate-binding protein [Micromonospora hortensis]|uniref:phosphate/phosphite/phosphonate ABC transporter substrate-binding protein n=1 Tax=Micromonospora hortensis TaxID=2911209 RepID=UPI001EE9A2FD|nr:PhnD/SsuA/transferrin family substrate-binding protein [Micromonospora hortensis]MCG5450478.1 PhnD/SsuA/transferrin family substrate-binding protein [Micromonospora hortensis]